MGENGDRDTQLSKTHEIKVTWAFTVKSINLGKLYFHIT